ncbi:MAG: hypothetical protein A2381_05620 [Bdellovibrionales bacterium RIFOXYB1_FULL_37_110]|nr:MAG: hypothetical protein A2417_06235 [Bdellovibrionales bacterium RIFOXYC1_FULL_37_79]OFZ58530.1 MAG: hypothetical protein A2381_05620 [Bdellovibrionales bacterium RIFOXYB1_FULL_37_110]OFZ63750.1 MAG: hypothetical protein A2577_07370 [Bdellovibrionales bacterium RIFOXYD1_FULL_36_51]OFZ66960.1 MAG: hypothetical protein A2328_05475 [Bdellovibrionales bacterium RIFOXYB2_FULL_36_6]
MRVLKINLTKNLGNKLMKTLCLLALLVSIHSFAVVPSDDSVGLAIELSSNRAGLSGRLMLSSKDLAMIKSGESNLVCKTAIDAATKRSVGIAFTAELGNFDDQGNIIYEQFLVRKEIIDSDGYEVLTAVDRKAELNGLYVDFRNGYHEKILVRDLTHPELRMEREYIEEMPWIKLTVETLNDNESGCSLASKF